jgi:site-specific recombinase XerC
VILWDSPTRGRLTWQALLQAFYGSCTAGTARAYKSAITAFYAHAGKVADRSPQAVTVADVIAWRDSLQQGGAAAATVRSRLAAVSSWFRWLMSQPALDGTRLVIENPASGVHGHKVPMYDPARSRKIDIALYRRIQEVIPDTTEGRRDRAWILAYVLTARRRREVALLRWTDLDIRGSQVFYRYVGKRQKSKQRELPQAVVRALEAWRGPLENHAGQTDCIWQVDASTFARRLKTYARAAGIEPRQVHVHGLRHLAADLMRQAGIPLDEIRQALDQESLSTTQIYLSQLEDPKDSISDRIGRFL